MSCVLAVCCTLLPYDSAFAYTYSGSHWPTKTKSVTISNTVTGNYQTSLTQAVNNINTATHVNFSTTTASSGWTAQAHNFGATGWEGRATWNRNMLGFTTSAFSNINMHYIPSGVSINRMRVLWLHELSHVWGLGHSSINTVMYTSASQAYRNGVQWLTLDDINGYNTLYY